MLYQDKINQTKQKLEKTVEELIGIYLDEMRDNCKKINLEQKHSLRRDLEYLIKKYTEENFDDTEFIEPIDVKSARKIRKESGYTLQELAEELGCSQSWIDRLERGLKPKSYSGTLKKYLDWLRAHGY